MVRKNSKKIFFSRILPVLLITVFTGLYVYLGKVNFSSFKLNKLKPTPTISAYETKCGIKEPHKIDDDIKKTLNLWENTLREFGDDISWSKHDCIKIEYKELASDNLGEFYPGYANELQEFIIYLDESLRGNYVISSVMLMHEISHLNQFVERLNTGNMIDCITAEVDAYHNEMSYILKLSDSNLKIYNDYIAQAKTKSDIKSKTLVNDSSGSMDVFKRCNNACPVDVVYDKCVWSCFDLTMEKNIRNTPKYLEICKDKYL